MLDDSKLCYDSSFFQCYICMQNVKKPRMCPSCSKLACETCLRKWIQDSRSECPHCRKVLALSGFADCERFVNDIKHLISTMDNNQKHKQKCKQHKLQMQYFCEQCKQPICSDCGMFGLKVIHYIIYIGIQYINNKLIQHKSHKITHLSKIYQQNKNKILNELARFDQKIQSYRKNGFYIKLQMQKLMIQIGQKKSFIEEYFLSLIQRLEEQFRLKKIKLQNQYEENHHQVQLLEAFRDQICHQLEGKSEKQVISNSEDLINQIHKLCEKEKYKQFLQEDYNFQTIQQIVPKYQLFNYIMGKNLLNHEGITYSQPYIINGIEWRLKLYPRGNGVAKQSHISVFLQMSKAYSNQNKYQYKIQLINHYNHKDTIIRQYSSKFDIGECWGYNQFIPLTELENGFIDLEGRLHFNISVRNPTYKSLVRDQENYIKYLENKLKSNQYLDNKYNNKSNEQNIKSRNEIISKLSLKSQNKKQQLKKVLTNNNNNDENKLTEQFYNMQISSNNNRSNSDQSINNNRNNNNSLNNKYIENVDNIDNMVILEADSIEDEYCRMDQHNSSIFSSP